MLRATHGREYAEERQANLEDLRRRSLSALILSVASFAYVWADYQFISGTFFLGAGWGPVLLGFGSGLTYVVLQRNTRLAFWALMLSMVGAIGYALWFFGPGPASSTPIVIVMISGLALSPAFTSGFGLACITLVYVIGAPSSPLPPVIITLLALVTSWITQRSLYTAIDWAWESYTDAQQKMRLARDRQAELQRTTKALKEASYRIRRMNVELAEARHQAVEARRMKERFAANVSHELRTPLNLIVGFSKMMYLSPEIYGDIEWPPALCRDVYHIYQSSRYLSEMIDDVLDLSRIEALPMPVSKEWCDLDSIIDSAVSIASDLFRQKDLTLHLDIHGELPTLFIDRIRIRQVLLNLLKNASRYTDQGHITISAVVQDGDVTVSVADTGIGIPPDQIPKLFEEFSQVDVVSKRQDSGTGLGLAICKHFVKLHGGRIWVESQVDKGSTFFFTLPLSETGVPFSQFRPTEPLEPTHVPRQASLVVLDEDSSAARILDRYLDGYHIVGAENEDQARELVEEWHPQALIINETSRTVAWDDLQEQFAHTIPYRLPVIRCSLPSQQWRDLAQSVLASITKPISQEQLISTLGRVEGAKDVLIIDDDRGFVQLVLRMLQACAVDYEARWAYDGQAGWAQITTKRPDVILLDLLMPGTTGFELLERLREDRELKDVPVVILTALGYEEDMLRWRKGTMNLACQQGLRTNEVICYLKAIIEAVSPQYGSPIPGELDVSLGRGARVTATAAVG